MSIFKPKHHGKGKPKSPQKWYVQFKDHHDIWRRVPGYTDRKLSGELDRKLNRLVSQRSLNQPLDSELVKWVESMAESLRKRLLKFGLLDSVAVSHNIPLKQHAEDFAADVRNKRGDDEYAATLRSRVLKTIEGCRFTYLTSVVASRVTQFLAELKKPAGGKPGVSQATANHYLQAMKQFMRWMVTEDRASKNPIAHLKQENSAGDIRRERRELADGEIGRLLRSARAGKTIYGLTGWQRFTLYAAAIQTGLRAKELASITPDHFDFDTDIPTVRIDAVDEKAKRGAVIPLPSQFVEIVKPWILSLQSKNRIWDGTWAEKRRGHKIIQHDLKKANVPYRTEDGQADFHALRHTYLSRLGRSGASAKAMQKLARHSTVELTIGRYTHANLFDLGQAVDGMQPLALGNPDDDQTENVEHRSTGTDDVGTLQKKTHKPTHKPDSEQCLSVPFSSNCDADQADEMRSESAQKNAQNTGDSSVSGDEREWMGIEPTWRLFSRHTGFEAQGGHQIREHSRMRQSRRSRGEGQESRVEDWGSAIELRDSLNSTLPLSSAGRAG